MIDLLISEHAFCLNQIFIHSTIPPTKKLKCNAKKNLLKIDINR